MFVVFFRQAAEKEEKRMKSIVFNLNKIGTDNKEYTRGKKENEFRQGIRI